MLLLFLSLVAVLELAHRLPLIPAFAEMSACSRRSLRTIRRGRVSEWVKERALQLLARRLFARSIRAGALLVAVASPLLAVLALHYAMGDDLDWATRLGVVPLTLGYALLRWQVAPALRRRVQPR
ncbi:hypothetical protein P1X14_00735 [Sphingomonas sp. AOB5]|uniref:hypothetical protein n=1 Tax=Sphingomonas sp. AOB5 TaxID=3034017 RepID=UPI0023F74C7C|nr:hypothetical protein [Sphingomonas sp. AOB5]MDF7773758.1 hypothetical protein [Sphingomonas sp. AOB5]